jgi:AcrR family transcriptional regulator
MGEKKPEKREDLLLRLARALADDPRASMGQLASMAGVSRATLCRYYSSRETLDRALFETGLSRAEQALARALPDQGSAHHAMQRLIDELLPIAELYAHVERRMQIDAGDDTRVQILNASLVALFHHWQGAGALRVDLPAAWLVESMSALLRSAATMIRSGRLARHDAAQSVFNLMWQGIAR